MKFKVTQTIQSPTIDGDAPVPVQHYQGDDHAAAIAAMVNASLQPEPYKGFVPYLVIKVTLDIID